MGETIYGTNVACGWCTAPRRIPPWDVGFGGKQVVALLVFSRCTKTCQVQSSKTFALPRRWPLYIYRNVQSMSWSQLCGRRAVWWPITLNEKSMLASGETAAGEFVFQLDFQTRKIFFNPICTGIVPVVIWPCSWFACQVMLARSVQQGWRLSGDRLVLPCAIPIQRFASSTTLT